MVKRNQEYIGRAIEFGGDIYGLSRTIITLVSLTGDDFQDKKLDIMSNCEDIEARVVRILDQLEAIDRQTIPGH